MSFLVLCFLFAIEERVKRGNTNTDDCASFADSETAVVEISADCLVVVGVVDVDLDRERR